MQISDVCLQSYPCQHTVTINGERQGMSGDKIYLWHVERGLRVPDHFKEYKSLVESRNVQQLIASSKFDDLSKLTKQTVEDAFKNTHGRTAMTCGCQVSLEMVKFLRDKFNFPLDNECLIEAVKSGSLELVQFLIENGLSPVSQGKTRYCGHGGSTAYSMAAEHSHTHLLSFFEAHFPITDVVRIDALFQTKPKNPTIHTYISSKIDPIFLEIANKVNSSTLTRQECFTLLGTTNEDTEKDKYEYLCSYLFRLLQKKYNSYY